MGLVEVLKRDIDKAKYLLIKAYPKIVELINNSSISEIEKTYAKFVCGAYYFGLGNIKKDYQKAFEIIKECADGYCCYL